MTCESKNQVKSEKKSNEENFRNESDNKYANINSNNKIECRNLRDRCKLKKL